MSKQTENIINAPWSRQLNTLKDVMDALREDSSHEFQVCNISSRWNGATATGKELREQGVTHVQVRYGKGNSKVWYGKL